jgi:hypothetical protein
MNLHWINGSADDRADLCAHARVEFRTNGDVLIRPDDGIWTVSAAAVYLLRTLSRQHTKSEPVELAATAGSTSKSFQSETNFS